MAAKDNLEFISNFYKRVFIDWNLDLIDKLVAPDFVGHELPEGTPPGPGGFKAFYRNFLASFPDFQYEVEDIIAGEEKAVVRWKGTCTQKGEFKGIPPTGKSVQMKGIAIYRIKNGQVRERWVEMDALGLMQQLGVIPEFSG